MKAPIFVQHHRYVTSKDQRVWMASELCRLDDGALVGDSVRLGLRHRISLDKVRWVHIDEVRDYTYFELRTLIEGDT
jgi:hypothetical protein